MDYKSITVKPVTPRIGAEIGGVDLVSASEAQIDEIKTALAEHLVLFFRDQPLTHEAHRAFGMAFGPLAGHSGVPSIPEYPDIVRIHIDANSSRAPGEKWHSDLSSDPEPPLGSILALHTVPESGGDTLFASMYAAYDALSPRMKTYLEGLTAIHDGNHVYKRLFPDSDKSYPVSEHPVIRTHPVTGRKLLFVNSSYTTHLVGVPRDESDAILAFLFAHVTHPNFQVRFRWQPNSIAFWDNRSTQHLATWDYFPETRSGYRVTVAGDKPF